MQNKYGLLPVGDETICPRPGGDPETGPLQILKYHQIDIHEPWVLLQLRASHRLRAFSSRQRHLNHLHQQTEKGLHLPMKWLGAISWGKSMSVLATRRGLIIILQMRSVITRKESETRAA